MLCTAEKPYSRVGLFAPKTPYYLMFGLTTLPSCAGLSPTFNPYLGVWRNLRGLALIDLRFI